jgi:hypothetical protein
VHPPPSPIICQEKEKVVRLQRSVWMITANCNYSTGLHHAMVPVKQYRSDAHFLLHVGFILIKMFVIIIDKIPVEFRTVKHV